VVDVFFWPGENNFAGIVLGCLTVTGDIVLLQCIVPASLTADQRGFLGEVDEKQEIYLRNWNKISKSEPKDALSVTIIAIEKGYLVAKSTKKDELVNL
jgi:hypothetical protein